MNNIFIRPLEFTDQDWLPDFLITHWGSRMLVSRGRLFDVSTNPGWVIFNPQNTVIGLSTYHSLSPDSCEITCLERLHEAQGMGTQLIQTVFDHAKNQGWQRVWLVTTNDNLNAMRFYQKRGVVFKAVYPNAAHEARQLKPEIPTHGCYGIPIRDELEFEYILA